MEKRYRATLTEEERQDLQELASVGRGAARPLREESLRRRGQGVVHDVEGGRVFAVGSGERACEVEAPGLYLIEIRNIVEVEVVDGAVVFAGLWTAP
jgi:hypothetical protein